MFSSTQKFEWCLCTVTVLLSAFVIGSTTDQDELVRQQRDASASEQVHSRQKRFVFFNTHSPVDIGLVATVPLSFALPTFPSRPKKWQRFKRSITEENNLMANLTSEDILPSGSYDEPAYSVELGKISTYFNILEIDEDVCQQRFICELFAEPEKYKPVGDIFKRNLIVDRGSVSEKQSSRYYRYVNAMHVGVSGGEKGCGDEYKRCPYSVEERLNMPALHFWTYLTSILGMEFRDD